MHSFPHPNVTPIVGIPAYDILVDSIYQISSNSEIGSRKLGFSVLAVSPMVYANLYATSFLKPANPGPAPAIPTNTTGIEHNAIRYMFTLDTELYSFLQNMHKSLKQQLMGDMEDIYFRALKEKYSGYGTLTCLEVIDHLKENY